MSASQFPTPASVPAVPSDVVVGVTMQQLREALGAAERDKELRELKAQVAALQIWVRRMLWALALGLLFAGGNLLAIWQLPGKFSQLEQRVKALENRFPTSQHTQR